MEPLITYTLCLFVGGPWDGTFLSVNTELKCIRAPLPDKSPPVGLFRLRVPPQPVRLIDYERETFECFDPDRCIGFRFFEYHAPQR